MPALCQEQTSRRDTTEISYRVSSMAAFGGSQTEIGDRRFAELAIQAVMLVAPTKVEDAESAEPELELGEGVDGALFAA
jgi:hypothetical protein